MSVWVRLVVAVATLKCVAAIAVAMVSGGQSQTPLPFSPYQYGLLVLAFAAPGIALIAARTRDLRAVWLGCILVLTAAPFAGTLLSCCAPPAGPAMPAVFDVLRRMPVEPLLPVFLWLFARHFPDEPASRLADRLSRLATIGSLALAVILIVANISLIIWPVTGTPLPGLRAPLSNETVTSLYWPLIIIASLPALGFLIWKTWTARPADRRRVNVFVAGLLIGFAPVSVSVLLEAMSPAYARFSNGPAATRIAEVIFLSLAAMPFVTAYSVMVDRVVEIRLVIRSALHTSSRSTRCWPSWRCRLPASSCISTAGAMRRC